MRSKIMIFTVAAGLSLAACSTTSGSHSVGGHSPAHAQSAVAVPVTSASPTPSPSPTLAGLSHACKRRLAAWLGGGGRSMLHAIHDDLSHYAKDDGAVVHGLLYGGNIAGAIAKWQADLSVSQQDAASLRGNPAPSCGGGRHLGRAAADWLTAVAAYQSAAQILASSPNMGGVSESDPHINAGNRGLSRAEAVLKRAVRESEGLIKNITKGTGT
jgi:hypothetical protein